MALPAHAAFGDCNDDAYIARFDARLATGSGFLCTESEHVPVVSDAGTTHIRVIQHLVADWATAPGAMRSIKDGVAASAAAMPRLGSFRIPDVTILLVDGFGPASGGSEDFGDIAAWTDFTPADECRITLWLLGPGARASYAAAVVAHELFHCVQGASTSHAQMFSYPRPGFPGGGALWQEGSADWFSTLAVPAPRFLDDRVTAFDAHSPDTALDMMSYDAYVFFIALLGRPRARPGSGDAFPAFDGQFGLLRRAARGDGGRLAGGRLVAFRRGLPGRPHPRRPRRAAPLHSAIRRRLRVGRHADLGNHAAAVRPDAGDAGIPLRPLAHRTAPGPFPCGQRGRQRGMGAAARIARRDHRRPAALPVRRSRGRHQSDATADRRHAGKPLHRMRRHARDRPLPYGRHLN
ncbi:hypothetical protein H1235_08300 [Pseudoxanthomonas sp. NC8]|nr:hypothetical protein H1235_08300 [Pseudoxanthomonas sp. NC8]